MLVRLRIQNFAIIDEIDLEFSSGLVAVTGETGAGKSILVDALLLALGFRGSSDVVRSGAERATVEVLFDISQHPQVRARLEARDLVGDDVSSLLIRRSIVARGRGKVTVNGRLATVATLREIACNLVDISGQHDQQSLLQVENHLEILDSFGDLAKARARYGACYERYLELKQRCRVLEQGAVDSARRADFLRFQIEEIDAVDPQHGELENLEDEQRRLAGAEKLEAGVRVAESLLYSDDGSAFDRLGRAIAELEALTAADDGLMAIIPALEAAKRELEDVSRHLAGYAGRIDGDPERLGDVLDRIAILSRLSRKHAMTLGEIVDHRGAMEAELDALGDLTTRSQTLEGERDQAFAEAYAAAERLSEARQRASMRLGRAVSREVADMDLDGAKLEVSCRRREADGPQSLSASGLDDVQFLWAPNRGEAARPLHRIASGGELSRLMLAVKTVLSKRDLVSLYVFDEVDSGIGGRAADRIGAKLQLVSGDHQAIVITHLAPIAARADHHWVVLKSVRDGRTVSDLVEVSGKSRSEELARMIDGASTTGATRRAAEAMLARVQADVAA